MTFRPFMDNVFLELEPLPTVSAGGLHLPQQSWLGARGSRYARVIASGPGFYLNKPGGARGTVENGRAFVPNQTKPGDRVVVDALAGTVYDGELSAPRHNKETAYGLMRVVREQEILAIVEDDGA